MMMTKILLLVEIVVELLCSICMQVGYLVIVCELMWVFGVLWEDCHVF